MNGEILSVGNVLKINETGKHYRVVSIRGGKVSLCEMETTKFSLFTFEQSYILSMLHDNTFVMEKEESVLFDVNTLSSDVRADYEKKLHVMHEVVNVYGPTFEKLTGRKSKPELNDILKKYSMSSSTFWRTCVRYFQSGMKDYSLIDTRYLGFNKGKHYDYSEKPGKKSTYFESSGVVRDETLIHHFEETLKEYKSGRQKTFRAAYDYMNLLHYTKTEMIKGVSTIVLLPESERPTFDQFYYYARQHLTKEEKDIIKTSAREHRNDKRLITSDSLSGVAGPGDMVEIDACEADVSLVSTLDRNRTVGRPIVYFMIDIFTRIILAVSVAFDNNSVLGITNLFLNLADDKKKYCARYGIGFDDDRLWPSNIIPRRIRVDRGSEFKSGEFGRICSELGIEKQLVSGASGSLKGTVEQSFHQMHLAQNVHLEDYGLIEKRYDSEHHKEATLNIEQYTRMVINFILTHNQKYNEQYPLTKEMIDKNIKPIPTLLWQYGIDKFSHPRPIPERNQYLFNLMKPVKAKVSRRGISYKDLWYLPENDPELRKEMFNAGTKKITFEVRMDMRCVGAVYYLRKGQLICAPLNSRLNGNADYSNLTMSEWEEYRHYKKEMDAQGRLYNEQLSAYRYAANAAIVDEAKKESISSDKNIRSARSIEKQMVSSNGKMQERITEENLPEARTPEPDGKEKSQNRDIPVRRKYSSFEEALLDFNDN